MSDRLPMSFAVYASLWDRIVFAWHGLRYRTSEIMPADEGALLIECTCGGHAQIRRQDDGFAEVELATCRRWVLLRKLQRAALPAARALP